MGWHFKERTGEGSRYKTSFSENIFLFIYLYFYFILFMSACLPIHFFAHSSSALGHQKKALDPLKLGAKNQILGLCKSSTHT